MTRPTRYLIRIVLFLLIILGLALALQQVLVHAFMVNPGLDGVIVAVLVLGIGWNLHLIIRLFPEVRWVNLLRQQREGLKVPSPPRLLSPMARLLRARRENNPKLAFSTQTTRAMLESLEARMDEGREISRYVTQLLVFLGLLGTFYGLILTVRSVAEVINAMPSGGADLSAMFGQIKTGLSKPLGGMSTAFSASMFGLAGSLILGFLDLTTGQAQNRFANEIEEWLADLTFLDAPGKENDRTTSESDARAQAEKTAAMEAWLPRVQDFMRITTENLALLQQNITVLRRIMETDGEQNDKVLLSLRSLNTSLNRLPADPGQKNGEIIREGHIAILHRLGEISEVIRQNGEAAAPHGATPHEDETARSAQNTIIERLDEIGQKNGEIIREGHIAILHRLGEISEVIRQNGEAAAPHGATPHEDETARSARNTIIERLDEIGEMLRQNHGAAIGEADVTALQTILRQVEESNQAILHSLKGLSHDVNQRSFEDPAVTYLLQEMGKQLAGLRRDLTAQAETAEASHPAGHEEG